ncbi:MAG: outer membrane protein assembly factor BamC [Gammaproteobacteria bacterium]|nr:outer membrane protein assembly factor BamC [Gammaproteobacteria bacterium]
MIRYSLLLFVCLSLGACGWLNDDEGMFVDRKDDYLEAEQLPPLEVPADMKAEEIADPFPIPPSPKQANARYFPERPPLPDAIYSSDNRREVRIQRLSDRRWLAIPEPPTTVWPKLKQFLAENGVAIVHEQPVEGRIDTDWFRIEPAAQQTYRDVVRLVLQDVRAQNGLAIGQDRLRIRLERGMQDQSSEIHLRHENDSQGLPSPAGVASLATLQSSVPQAEDELLKEIGAYIAARVAEQTVSRVATEIAGTEKAELDRNDQGRPVLRLRLDYERAWAALSRALENGGVEILAEDEKAGTYDIRVTEAVFAGEEPGFFSRMFSFGGDDPDDLRIKLVGAEEDHSVLVDLADGSAADEDLAEQVLALIREFSV